MKQIKLTIAAFCAMGLMVSCGVEENKCAQKPAADLNDTLKEDIRLNQLGYYPKSQKKFVVAGSTAECFNILDAKGTVVFSGDLVDKGHWALSNETLRVGDFSALQTEGSYTIEVSDKGASHAFDIKPELYNDMLDAVSKTYYYQRMSTPITEEHGGIYKRPAGQPDDTVFFHASTGKVETTWSRHDSLQGVQPYAQVKDLPEFKNVSKGWFDAADFNKYTVNSGSTLGFLFMTYEKYPQLFPDNHLNIPESGSGQSDMLDEIKWNLDWIETMQDDDGGAFVKVSELGWEWTVMPHQWVKDRYIIGKSTAATLNLSASLAMAGRIYKDTAVTARYISRAEKAWKWAVENPEVYYTNQTTPDVGSGNYPDEDVHEEFLWAASELYITTKKQEYLDYLTNNMKKPCFKVCSWGTFGDNIGFMSLINSGVELPKELNDTIINTFTAIADEFVDTTNMLAYGTPSEVFEWGSNSEMLARTSIVGFVYEQTKDAKYLNALTTVMDYIMGKNAAKYAFVTGFGDKYPMHMHHRQSQTDKVDEPIPGFLIGGPNDGREDDIIYNKENGGAKTAYPVKLPAVSYVDEYDSYASNEVTINWNAILINNLAVIIANDANLK